MKELLGASSHVVNYLMGLAKEGLLLNKGDHAIAGHRFKENAWEP